jgi:2-haloacid dehalogenase
VTTNPKDGLAIVFDFGRVLIDWDPRYLFRKFFGQDEQAMECFIEEVRFYDWIHQLDSGGNYAEGVASACARYPQYCHLFQAYHLRYDETIIGAIEPTVEIMRRLKRAGYPLYGLSNWPVEKFAVVRPRYDLFDDLDEIVISGQAGSAKPEPGIYQSLLERAGRKAEQCLFIDDSADNIAAARRLGFQTILYQTPEQLRQALAGLGIVV